MIFIIPGRPIPWQRARTNNGHYFDSQALQKKKIQSLFKSTYPEFKPLEGPLKVEFTFTYLPPETMLVNKKRIEMLSPMIKVPDTSNLIKFYEDALNKFLWTDDKLIWSLHGEKIYADEEKTVVLIE